MNPEELKSAQSEQAPASEITPELARTNELRRLTKFASDPSEVTAFLQRNAGEGIIDPIAGNVAIRESLVKDYAKFALDLGQAAGLIKSGTAYDGGPKRIVDETLSKLYGPQPVIAAFRESATKYIETAIAEANK
jgi:hypothetical protein